MLELYSTEESPEVSLPVTPRRITVGNPSNKDVMKMLIEIRNMLQTLVTERKNHPEDSSFVVSA